MRCRHRRAAVGRIGAIGDRRDDAHPRCADVDRRGAEAREAGEVAVRLDCGHGDHAVPAPGGVVRALVVRRVRGGAVVVAGRVPCRSDEEDAAIPAPVDGVEQRLAEPAPAPRVARSDEVQAVPGLEVVEVVDGSHRVSDGATGGPEELGRDHRDVPVDAGHADSVAADAADRAGDVGGVVVGRAVVDRAVVVDEVVAVDVVDVAVAVIVDAVAGDLAGVGPDVRSQVGVQDLDPLVDDADHDVGRTRGAVRPRLAGVAAEGVGRRGGVAVHAPEVVARVHRVVRGGVGLNDVVRLCVAHAGCGLQCCYGPGRAHPGVEHEPLGLGKRRHRRGRSGFDPLARSRPICSACKRTRNRIEPDEYLPLDEGRVRFGRRTGRGRRGRRRCGGRGRPVGTDQRHGEGPRRQSDRHVTELRTDHRPPRRRIGEDGTIRSVSSPTASKQGPIGPRRAERCGATRPPPHRSRVGRGGQAAIEVARILGQGPG